MQPNPNPNPSPKIRFLQNGGFVAAHLELIQRADFERAVDFALLEMMRLEESAEDAAASHYRMAGAIQFVRILKHLGTTVVSPRTRTEDNLDMQK